MMAKIEDNCRNCVKYPLCRAFTQLNQIIDKESLWDYSGDIWVAIAKGCSYYKKEGKR